MKRIAIQLFFLETNIPSLSPHKHSRIDERLELLGRNTASIRRPTEHQSILTVPETNLARRLGIIRLQKFVRELLLLVPIFLLQQILVLHLHLFREGFAHLQMISLKVEHIVVNGVAFRGVANFLAVEAAEANLADLAGAVVILRLFKEFDAMATGKAVDSVEDVIVGGDEEADGLIFFRRFHRALGFF
eukprot:CAMPEP_0184466024 /NCGR_PEP_ID=MMETSP0740-20130409/64434_1 /TAXON_ID=385413 /ORGANISM="Thalassiosira miniscula, Strain CCMP1093" /LENGTH=188 /DNA_ID=CAMNT_0026841001 /DNA_START=199 /DNA_END=762 /DNA_ORIENTATION=-